MHPDTTAPLAGAGYGAVRAEIRRHELGIPVRHRKKGTTTMTPITEAIADLLARNNIVAEQTDYTITTPHGKWRTAATLDTFPSYLLIQEGPTSGTVLHMPATCRQDFISTAARIISAAADAEWGYTDGQTAAVFIGDGPHVPDVFLSEWAQDNIKRGIWQTNKEGEVVADGFRLPLPHTVEEWIRHYYE